jgi:hypothetical protein
MKDLGRATKMECQQGMAKLQQIIVGASHKHIGSTLKGVRLDWNFFVFGQKRVPRDIEDIGHDVKGY